MAVLALVTAPISALSHLQVLNIMWAIYGNQPSIRAVSALNNLDRALLMLTGKHPSGGQPPAVFANVHQPWGPPAFMAPPTLGRRAQRPSLGCEGLKELASVNVSNIVATKVQSA